MAGDHRRGAPLDAGERRAYAQHGLPWYGLYDEGESTLEPSSVLQSVGSVKEHDHALFGTPLQDDDPIPPGPVRRLWTRLSRTFVRDGHW